MGQMLVRLLLLAFATLASASRQLTTTSSSSQTAEIQLVGGAGSISFGGDDANLKLYQSQSAANTLECSGTLHATDAVSSDGTHLSEVCTPPRSQPS